MTNKARQKGTAWESALVKWLTPHFPHAHRNPLASPDGDIGGVLADDSGIFEAKDCVKQTISEWLNQASKSAERNGARKMPFVLHKRRGRNTENGYVTMPGWAFLRLLITYDLYEHKESLPWPE